MVLDRINPARHAGRFRCICKMVIIAGDDRFLMMEKNTILQPRLFGTS